MSSTKPGGSRGTSDPVPGRATAEGTRRYRDRFAGRVSPDHFREMRDLIFSSIGMGTYLGDPGDEDDERYRKATRAAVVAGCNVIDTAVNYRFQRSERNVGDAIRQVIEEGGRRDELIVATKGGFIPFDGAFPPDPAGWFRSALLEPGIARPRDVVANCHIMTPRYLESQIRWSLANLGLESIDIYYVHNPETQLQEIDRSEFVVRMTAAFELLERKVAEGVIGLYGVATWDGLRHPPGHRGHLSLEELLRAAERAGGSDHHFRAIQLPVNLAMPEAIVSATQRMGDRSVPLAQAASERGMIVMASGSLLQGQVIDALGPEFATHVPGATTSAQRGLQIVRSAPGLTTALVGMKSTDHVEENLALASLERMPEERAAAILQSFRPG